MRSITFISVALVILCGCSGDDLLVNNNFKYDYSIEQSRSCFCPNSGEKVKIFVRSDTIADVILLSDNSHLAYSSWQPYRTIKGLLREVALWADTVRFAVKVSYDPLFHYPSFISVNPKPFMVNDTIVSVMTDAGFTYETHNFIKYK
jgi:hypothetical protein